MDTSKFKKLLTLSAAITAILQAQAQAQDVTHNPLEEIVITANRIALPLRQIGTSVSVITEADIQAHGNLGLTDVLRQLPAIATSNNGGAGKTTSLRIRGEEGFRTLTILDGLRLMDPSGPQVGSQLEHMLSSGVGRVEILRGPQGLSYGADAGGVINITSLLANDGIEGNLDLQGGKFGTQQINANVSGGNDLTDLFLSLTDYQTDGFNTLTADTVLADNDGYENTSLHGRIGVNITDKVRFDLTHRDVSGDSMIDGCYDTTTFATIHDCLALYDLQASRAAVAYEDESFSHNLSYATTRTERDNLNNGISAFAAKGEINRWEYVGSATNLPGFDLVFGADLEEALNNDEGRDNTGVYMEYLSDFSDNFFLTAGARHDDNDDFGTNTSYRVSSAYLIDLADASTLKFRGSYGTGFRAPSPYEISYNNGPYAFPPASLLTLKQETSQGHEAGIEYLRSNGLRLEAVYFDQDVDDAIYFDLTSYAGYLQDIGTSNSSGVELSVEYPLGHSWNFSANYTYNDTERPNGLQRLRRPEDLFNLGVSFHGLQERLNLNAFYRISRDSINQVGTTVVPLADFDVLDLTANFSFTDSLQIYGRLENALDENYQEITGYNTAGRAAYVGFRFNYAGL